MKKLSERDMDEIESVKHFIRYVNTNPDIHTFEIFDAMIRLETIGQKYVLNGYDEKDMEDLLELEDMKDLLRKFISRLKRDLNIKDDSNI